MDMIKIWLVYTNPRANHLREADVLNLPMG